MARVVSTRHIPSMYRSNDLYNWCPIESDEISSEPVQEIKMQVGPMECVRSRNFETVQRERKLALNRERVRRYRAKQKKSKKS